MLWRQLRLVSAGSKPLSSDRWFCEAPSGAFFVSEGCGVNGTYKCSRNYRALALSVLGCAYLAFAPLSAIAQGAGGKGVSVTVNPTTGYAVINSQTIGTPKGTTIGPSGGPPSVTVRPVGGLSQSLPAGIEITGLRQNAQTLRGPLGVNINTGLNSLKNGAVRCLTSMRCSTLLGLGSLGLQALLDSMDWELGPDGRPTELGPYPDSVPEGIPSFAAAGYSFVNPNLLPEGHIIVYREPLPSGHTQFRSCALRARIYQSDPYSYLYAYNPQSNQCFYTAEGFTPDRQFVSPSAIADAVNDNYSPDPTDWNWLTGGMNFSDPDVTIEITDVPILDGSNEPNFIQWSDGTSRGTFNIYTPTVRNNNSSKPEIEVKDEQTEISYDEQGNPTGSNTSTSILTPSPGGSPSSPDINIPTDCDFMPTVCRFIDWFTEPDPLPDPDDSIRDLVQVYEDGGRQVEVGPSMGSCPPPRVVALSFVPAVEVSFQPFCDLAAAVRYWLLAIAYFGAAYLTVRSI